MSGASTTNNNNNIDAVKTMLSAAMTSAYAFRRKFDTLDMLTLISNEKVRTSSVENIVSELAPITPKMREYVDRLRHDIAATPDMLWFASPQNGRLDIWQCLLVDCKVCHDQAALLDNNDDDKK
jgi:hypothetical protein